MLYNYIGSLGVAFVSTALALSTQDNLARSMPIDVPGLASRPRESQHITQRSASFDVPASIWSPHGDAPHEDATLHAYDRRDAPRVWLPTSAPLPSASLPQTDAPAPTGFRGAVRQAKQLYANLRKTSGDDDDDPRRRLPQNWRTRNVSDISTNERSSFDDDQRRARRLVSPSSPAPDSFSLRSVSSGSIPPDMYLPGQPRLSRADSTDSRRSITSTTSGTPSQRSVIEGEDEDQEHPLPAPPPIPAEPPESKKTLLMRARSKSVDQLQRLFNMSRSKGERPKRNGTRMFSERRRRDTKETPPPSRSPQLEPLAELPEGGERSRDASGVSPALVHVESRNSYGSSTSSASKGGTDSSGSTSQLRTTSRGIPALGLHISSHSSADGSSPAGSISHVEADNFFGELVGEDSMRTANNNSPDGSTDEHPAEATGIALTGTAGPAPEHKEPTEIAESGAYSDTGSSMELNSSSATTCQEPQDTSIDEVSPGGEMPLPEDAVNDVLDSDNSNAKSDIDADATPHFGTEVDSPAEAADGQEGRDNGPSPLGLLPINNAPTDGPTPQATPSSPASPLPLTDEQQALLDNATAPLRIRSHITSIELDNVHQNRPRTRSRSESENADFFSMPFSRMTNNSVPQTPGEAPAVIVSPTAADSDIAQLSAELVAAASESLSPPTLGSQAPSPSQPVAVPQNPEQTPSLPSHQPPSLPPSLPASLPSSQPSPQPSPQSPLHTSPIQSPQVSPDKTAATEPRLQSATEVEAQSPPPPPAHEEEQQRVPRLALKTSKSSGILGAMASQAHKKAAQIKHKGNTGDDDSMPATPASMHRRRDDGREPASCVSIGDLRSASFEAPGPSPLTSRKSFYRTGRNKSQPTLNIADDHEFLHALESVRVQHRERIAMRANARRKASMPNLYRTSSNRIPPMPRRSSVEPQSAPVDRSPAFTGIVDVDNAESDSDDESDFSYDDSGDISNELGVGLASGMVQEAPFTNDDDWKKEVKALFLIRELVQTERSYAQHLESLLILVLKWTGTGATSKRMQANVLMPSAQPHSNTPLRGTSGLAPQHLLTLRTMLPQLISVSRALVYRIEEKPSSAGVGQAFTAIREKFEEVHMTWSTTVGETLSALRLTEGTKSKSRGRLGLVPVLDPPGPPAPSPQSGASPGASSSVTDKRDKRQCPKALSPVDVAIMPTQRLARYNLLLRDLLSYTTPETESYTTLSTALYNMQELGRRCDLVSAKPA